MSKVFLFIFGIISSQISAQIKPVKNLEFPESDFVSYVKYENKSQKILFEIGLFEPGNYNLIAAANSIKIYKSKSDERNFNHKTYEGKMASFYLKITQNSQSNYFFLDRYHDIDSFEFVDLKSDNFLILKDIYTFYIYDFQKEILSESCFPGKNQYEGEDAISGQFDALTLFDEEKFLLGNVQGFGVFCFDISDLTHPKELKQFAIQDSNEGQNYTFFHESKNGIFDIIVANSDLNSESKNINNLYQKLENVSYADKKIKISKDKNGHPEIQSWKYFLKFSFGKKHYLYDLETGILMKN